MFRTFILALVAFNLTAVPGALGETEPQYEGAPGLQPTESSQAAPETKPIEPYRTFLNVQRYTIESNGEPDNPISNIRLELIFPDPNDRPEDRPPKTLWQQFVTLFTGEEEQKVARIHLPGGDQWWPIGNGQVQEINQIFEIPWEYNRNDGFRFTIQIHRKGTKIKPCNFDVVQLSEFNRGYICRMDLAWQKSQNIPEERLDKQGVQIRIFTDKNSPKRDIPEDAIALSR